MNPDNGLAIVRYGKESNRMPETKSELAPYPSYANELVSKLMPALERDVDFGDFGKSKTIS